VVIARLLYAIPAFVVAIVAVYVAFLTKQQKEISEAQKNVATQTLRLELLNKRLPIYQDVVELMSSVIASGKLTGEQDRLLRDWDNSHAFLFSQEVQEWIGKICSKASRRHRLHAMLKNKDIPDKHIDETNNEFSENSKWFMENESLILEAFQRDMRIDF